MNKNLKIGLILLISASVLFLCSSVAFFVLKEAEKDKRIYVEGRLSDTIKEKEALTNDLADVRGANKELGEKLDTAKEEARRIAEELAREKEAKSIISAQLKDEKERSNNLMAEVMKEKEERLGMAQRLSGAQQLYNELKNEYELLVDAKVTLENKLKKMMAEKGVELERIEVKSNYFKDEGEKEPPAPKARSRKVGDVLAVNKKFNFIVSNIGRLDGAEEGTELEIYRDDKFIAKTRIEKLYDAMSAAAILPEWKKRSIREGDNVRISY